MLNNMILLNYKRGETMIFHNKKFSGIDFHNNSISCATIKLERGIPVLQDIEKIKTEEDMIVGGRVSKADVLSDVLEDALSDGTLSKEVHLAIPTPNILIRKSPLYRILVKRISQTFTV